MARYLARADFLRQAQPPRTYDVQNNTDALGKKAHHAASRNCSSTADHRHCVYHPLTTFLSAEGVPTSMAPHTGEC